MAHLSSVLTAASGKKKFVLWKILMIVDGHFEEMDSQCDVSFTAQVAAERSNNELSVGRKLSNLWPW